MPLFFGSDFFLEARAEILKNRLFFGRNDDIINLFRNLLTFSTALLLKNPMEDWTFSIWEKIENRGIIWQYHKKKPVSPHLENSSMASINEHFHR